MTRAFPAAGLALAVAWGLGVAGALGDVPRFPDHERQLFFAEHLQRAWFERHEPRWYGGLDIEVHPPVAHQLVALLARVPGIGLERAYALMVLLAAMLVAMGQVRLAQTLGTPKQQRGWLMVAAVAQPCVWVALVTLGHYPAVLGLGLALNAIATAASRHETHLGPAAVGLLTAAAAASHPAAALLLLTGAPLLFKRRSAFAALGAGWLLGVACAWPFYARLTSGTFLSLEGRLPSAAWQLVALAVAALVAFATVTRQPLALWAALVGLVMLGMSAVKLPFVSPDAWVMYAVIVVTAGLAALEDAEPRVTSLLLAIAAFTTTAIALGSARSTDTRPRRAALREVEALLARPGEERFRYLTIGVGPEWLEMSRRLKTASADGGLAWVAPPVDELTGTDRAGLERLSMLLRDPRLAVKWVATANDAADDTLTPQGFRVVQAWRGSVRLWVRENTGPLNGLPMVGGRLPFGFSVGAPGLGLMALLALGFTVLREWRTPNAPDEVSRDVA